MDKLNPFEQAKVYAQFACEAMLKVNDVWTRCGITPVEVHHRITRARGGKLLDEVGESYHLMCLCTDHHKDAHDQPWAMANGLLLEGSVQHVNGRVVYTGPDRYLTDRHHA